jgi:hypothetical protein
MSLAGVTSMGDERRNATAAASSCAQKSVSEKTRKAMIKTRQCAGERRAS